MENSPQPSEANPEKPEPVAPSPPAPSSTPLRAGQPQNILDQPLPLVISQENLGAFYFYAHLISCNALVFLRRRVGERNLRMWVILFNVTLLMLLSGIGSLSLPTPPPWLHGQTSAPESAPPYPNGASPYGSSPYGGSPYGGSPYGGSPYGNPGFSGAPLSRDPGNAASPQAPAPDQGDGGAWIIRLYALALLLVGFYQNGMSKEWGEIPPGLHTRARGESRLGAFLNRHVIPPEWHGFGFDWSFTQWRFYSSAWFPLEERLIHAWLEPFLLSLLGLFFWRANISWMASFWLFLSSLTLKVCESQYYEIGRSLYLDRRDAREEAGTVREADEREVSGSTNPSDGEPPIDLNLSVKVSEELLARRKRRRLLALLNSPEDEQDQGDQGVRRESDENRLKREALERLRQRQNGKGGNGKNGGHP